MKYATTLLGVVGLISAAVVIPPNWSFEIASLNGPGYPDTGKSPTGPTRTTRLTLRSNTVDMNTPEDWYQFIAYPWLRVDLCQGHDHTWCQVTLNYEEYKNTSNTIEGNEYRMRLHKNETKGLATYDIGKGVQVYWDFAYQVDHQTEVHCFDCEDMTHSYSSILRYILIRPVDRHHRHHRSCSVWPMVATTILQYIGYAAAYTLDQLR
jgi:hypothetical protein